MRKKGNSNSADLDIGTLSGRLWEAANILRGPVDAADFKTYIFPLLFYKRLWDVYDEGLAGALGESSGDREYAALKAVNNELTGLSWDMGGGSLTFFTTTTSECNRWSHKSAGPRMSLSVRSRTRAMKNPCSVRPIWPRR